jgi:adenosine deaminase
MSFHSFIQAMPKVELHVHLEGAIQPETLLALAQRNRSELPAHTVEDIRRWYTFPDFSHFIDTYAVVSSYIQTVDDIVLVAREFLKGQAAQNIRYSEVTYSAYTHYHNWGLSFAEQLAALDRARAWAREALGVNMGVIVDVMRTLPAETGLKVAQRAVQGIGQGVVALGLAGPEVGHPPETFREAFDYARDAGLPAVPHAGEMVGPQSIWGALHALHAIRIGHGVRCLEDPRLVIELRKRQVPLEVCPSSNVALSVARSLGDHPLPRLLDAGLYVTINSDDPPMFNTTLTEEYAKVADALHLSEDDVERLVLNAVRASLLPAAERARLEAQFLVDFARLRGSSPHQQAVS